MEQKSKTAIIIPCLNHWDKTEECLLSICQNTDNKDVYIIIIDDGSTDKTKEVLKEGNGTYTVDGRVFQTWVVKNKKNRGFAVAVNQGIIQADKLWKPDKFCIFNNDMVVSPNWLPELQKGLKDKSVGMVTGTLIEPHEASLEAFKFKKSKPSVMIEWEKGGPWLFKREVFKRVGLLNEIYKFCQYEDFDLFLRMSYYKYKHGRMNAVYVYHYASVTQNGELKKRIGTDYRQQNRSKFIKLWGTADIDYQKAFEGFPQSKDKSLFETHQAMEDYKNHNPLERQHL